MRLFVCGLFLFWKAVDFCATKKPSALERMDLLTHFGLLALAVWLLSKAQSSTAISCTVLAIGLFLALKIPGVRIRATRIGSYGFAIILLVVLLNMTFNLQGLFVGLVGR